MASHINHKRGFAKLQPTAAELTLDELEARSKALEAEMAPTRPKGETPPPPVKPEVKPKPGAKPAPTAPPVNESAEDKEIRLEMERRAKMQKGFGKLVQ